MRRLALILALFWSAQGAVCLLPGLTHVHDSIAPTAADRADHASHGHHVAPAGDPANPAAPERDASCEQHCVSLAQTLSPTAPSVPFTAALWLPLDPPKAPLVGRIVAARRLDSHHGPPPPDLVVTNATFLI